MAYEVDSLFEELAKRLDFIQNSSYDNEAMRHELFVRPILTDPLILGWAGPELVEQETISLPSQVGPRTAHEHLTPTKRRADIVIIPYGLPEAIAVVEEKRRQKTLDALRRHVPQLREYQYLHHTIWGLLTDGEKWILLRNDQEFHVFANLSDMKNHLRDFQECIGKDAVIKRIMEKGTNDLLITACTPHVRGVVAARQWMPALGLQAFLMIPSSEGIDTVYHLSIRLGEKGYQLFNLARNIHADWKTLADVLFVETLACASSGYTSDAEFLLMKDPEPRLANDVRQLKDYAKGEYWDVTNHWIEVYTLLNHAYRQWAEKWDFSLDDLLEMCVQTGTAVHEQSLSKECLDRIRNHPKYNHIKILPGMSIGQLMKKIGLE
jgi:hypothetical protein